MPDRIMSLPEKFMPQAVGPLLREYRLMSKITRLQIAEKLNVSVDTITRWEYRRSVVPSDQMIRYASALGLEVLLFDSTEYRQLYAEHIARQEGVSDAGPPFAQAGFFEE